MYFVVFANYDEKQVQGRPKDDMAEYARDRDRHPGVTLLHGGTTLSDDGEAVDGMLMVVEADSLRAVRASSPTVPSASRASSRTSRSGRGAE